MASHPEFDKQTTGTDVARAFSTQIRGKIVLITGISPNSLGEALALTTALHSPTLLILASRNPTNLQTSLSKIQETSPNIKIKLVVVDLGDQTSIRHAASQILEDIEVPRIDVVINTAAATYTNKDVVKTANGKDVELQFAINHVGPFLFTNLLLPKLLKASSGISGATRVINVTSDAHILSPIRFSDYNFDVPKGGDIPVEERPVDVPWLKGGGGGYVSFIAYAQSKTGNILYSLSLNEKLGDKGLLSLAVHPGAIWTNLPRDYSPESRELEMVKKSTNFWKTHDQGIAPILVAAFDPALTASSGLYLSDCQIAEAARHASDSGAAEKLWKLTEELVGQTFDFGLKSQL